MRTEFRECIRVMVITNAYYRTKQWTLVFLVALLPCQIQVPTKFVYTISEKLTFVLRLIKCKRDQLVYKST